MKEIYASMTIILFLFSCSNGKFKENRIEQNVTISNTKDYEYDIGSLGDEEGAGIQIQAKHSEISEYKRDFSNGENIYRYKPTSGYVGRDYVEIRINSGSNGASPSTEITIIEITFNVTE